MATITLQELLENIEKAKQRMSRKNPHRLLFAQCQQALIQLAGEHSSKDAHAPKTDAVGR